MVIKKEAENFQSNDVKTLVNSIEKLVGRVDKLVLLFEEASKHVNEVQSTEEKVRTLAQKLEELVEQNKAIARGLLLLEKYVRGRTGMTDETKSSDYSGL
jgi:archaellum component FlaC